MTTADHIIERPSLMDWQRLYLRGLHLAEFVATGRWEDFFDAYRAYCREFQDLQGKQSEGLAARDWAVVNDLIGKIKRNNQGLQDMVSQEMERTAHQVRKLSGSSKGSYKHGH